MNRRKFLLGSSATLASAGFLTGTGAFTSAEAERNVKIEVVGDKYAYLGLREDQIKEEGVLFGTDMPRTAPEEFKLTNQTATAVDIDIKLLKGNLEFDEWTIGNEDKVDGVSVETNTLTIEGMEPGAKVSEVTIDIPGTSEFSVDDTLRFEVTGEDNDLYIEAERVLTLEPDEIPAVIRKFANVSSTFEIANLDYVNHSTVKVNGLDTEHKAKNKYKIKNPEFDCVSGDMINVTVTGKTKAGVDFTGTASVKCSQQQASNSENKGGETSNENPEGGEDSDEDDKGEGNSGDGNSGDSGNTGNGEQGGQDGTPRDT